MKNNGLFVYVIFAVFLLIIAVLLFVGIKMFYAHEMVKKIKLNHDAFYLYKKNKDNGEIIKSPYVLLKYNIHQLFDDSVIHKRLNWEDSYYITDTIEKKAVRIIGVDEDCWGIIEAYVPLEFVQYDKPDSTSLKIMARIKRYNDSLISNSPIKEKNKNEYGTQYGFYCRK